MFPGIPRLLTESESGRHGYSLLKLWAGINGLTKLSSQACIYRLLAPSGGIKFVFLQLHLLHPQFHFYWPQMCWPKPSLLLLFITFWFYEPIKSTEFDQLDSSENSYWLCLISIQRLKLWVVIIHPGSVERLSMRKFCRSQFHKKNAD